MLKNKISYFAILLSLGLLANVAIPVNYAFAQEDEAYEEEYEEESYEEDSASPKEESLLDKLANTDLDKVDLFQVISDMERKNMLIKLQMEQEKLQLNLQRLQQEKESMNVKAHEEKLKRDLKQRELDSKTAEEDLARQRAKAEVEKEQIVERRKQTLITAVAEAFAENPNQDYSGLLSMIKSENSGVVPPELKFIDDRMQAQQAEEKEKLAKQAASSIVVDQRVALEKALEVYSIIGIRGELIATVRNKLNAQSFKVKEGTQISNGFVVSTIAPEFITFTKGNETKTLYLNVSSN